MQSCPEVPNLARDMESSLRITAAGAVKPVNTPGQDVLRRSLPEDSQSSHSPRTSIGRSSWLGPPSTVEEVVKNIITVGLNSPRPNDLITRQHPCFAHSAKFWKGLGLPEAALDNHVRLACGKRQMPLILLLNPTHSHELPFAEMVETTDTLQYIRGKLGSVGLGLDDVPILDICPFLTDKWFKYFEGRDPAKVEHDLDEAYSLTLKMLDVIQPDVIFVCQCQTEFEPWKSKQRRQVSWKLCSTIKRATKGLAQSVEIGMIRPHVVWGFHPSHVLRLRKVAEAQDMANGYSEAKHNYELADAALTYLFDQLYAPYAMLKRKRTPQLENKWDDLRNNIEFQQKCIKRQEVAIEREIAEIAKLEDELRTKRKILEEENCCLREMLLRCMDMQQQVIAHVFPV